MNQIESAKKAAAEVAISQVHPDAIIGVGTGSTVFYFIEALVGVPIKGAVASSEDTATKLQERNIPVVPLNEVSSLPLYVDGADEISTHLQMIKGGGGALTREKIIAHMAKKFICIADHGKYKKALGGFPLPIEVIPMARSMVARELIKLGGRPSYRKGVITDNGGEILDVTHLNFQEPMALETTLNQIPGVISVGLFAHRGADMLLMGDGKGVQTKYPIGA